MLFRFAHPEFLRFLPAVMLGFIVVAIIDLRWTLKRLKSLSLPSESARSIIARRSVRISLLGIALVLFVVAASGPEFGVISGSADTPGMQLVICMDVSASMGAGDLIPNRLENAKDQAIKLLERMPPSLIGVVAFTRRAFTICPLTDDRQAVRQVISAIEVNLTPGPGSKISAGIEEASRVWIDDQLPKAIVLFTDGESHDDTTEIERRIEDAIKAGTRVFVVGVGTTTGALVPGKEITTKLDTETLNLISRKSKTQWTTDVLNLTADILKLNNPRKFTGAVEYRSIYRYPAVLALAVLAVELLL